VAAELTDDDYRSLHEFRYVIRCFLRFSEEAARVHGIEPQQHQILLAIRAGFGTSVASIAERMQLQHHSAVGLLDRVEARGLIERRRAEHDHRQVVISLTPEGERILHELSLGHLVQLRRDGPELIAALEAIVHETPPRRRRRQPAS
jgi:DNA-binding MarR family transcriptional regulator